MQKGKEEEASTPSTRHSMCKVRGKGKSLTWLKMMREELAGDETGVVGKAHMKSFIGLDVDFELESE